ncbi:hypothetical protein HXX76_012595 [Chlamydomonas incerta]|uniref:Glycosyl transferase CAP10 domain-containing protein n=1 Tax=Chlamydomonas incerta TaxID=51695 RepID=A0A835SRS4_CHLIN|nr:hypothetical protein HXX76_012595 [Chlamydomonas incerta]|eukprot:KAG2427084.1 hypothetical protein HXX76_012595 [Chlamydomonas incerta]
MQWNASDLPFLDHSVGQDILVLPLPRPGYEHANGTEWEEFLRQNLYQDLEKYGNATARRVTLSALHTLMQRLTSREHLKTHAGLVVLRRGRAYLAKHSGMVGFVKTRITRNIERMLAGAAALGLTLPDTVFAYSGQDEAVCKHLSGACSHAPVFSHIKRYDHRRRRSVDSDVLIPHLGHTFNTTSHFPWPAKDPRALLRASLQSSMDAKRCMRTVLARLGATPNGSRLLDCGFVANNHHTYKMPESHMKKYMSMTQHARYRLVVNADGHTASSRLGYLLTLNSAVMTQGDSPWIEYYYRSLTPGTHLLTYNATSVLGLVAEMQDPARDAQLRAMVDAAQHFAAKFITPEQKVRYWVAALRAYAALAPPQLGGIADGMKGLRPGSSKHRLGSASTSAILDALRRDSGTSSSSSSKSSSKSKSSGSSKKGKATSSKRRSTKLVSAGKKSAKQGKVLAEVWVRLRAKGD